MAFDFLMYRSRARGLITHDLLIEVMGKSIANNAREGLTGFLHWDQDYFLQYIEGPSQALQRRVVKIFEDRRHHDLQVLAEGETEARLFPDWDMGLLDPQAVPRCAANYGAWAQQFRDLEPQALLHALAAQGGQMQLASIEALRVA